MSEYRDELAAAHARIIQLEEELGRRPKPFKPTRAPWVIVALAALGVVGSCATVARSVLRRGERVETARVVAAPTDTAAPAPHRIYASWYPASRVTPEVVDVNGDGDPELVGLFWRAGDDAQALYAAAFSVKSRALVWSAGPFPSQWSSTRTHFAVVGDRMVVTDSQDNVRVLDLRTGDAIKTQTLVGGATVACVLPGAKGRALLRERSYLADSEGPAAIDVATGAIEEAPQGARCPYRAEPACDEKGARAAATAGDAPCVSSGEVKGPKPKTPKATAWGTYSIGDHDVAIGRIGDGVRSVPFAWGWERGKKAASWEARLTVDGEAPHYGSPETLIRERKLFTLYQNRAGKLIVTAHDVAAGGQVWSHALEGTAEGSHVSAFDVKGGYALVAVNQTVHVLDAGNGTYLFALDAGVM
jgi:hypothetical protein